MPNLLGSFGSRSGARPLTRLGLPHTQLDQWPPVEIIEKLAERCLALPNVREKQSQVAAPSVRALWIPDEIATRRADAFICDHEFCHLHPPPYGSLHITLPHEQVSTVVESGWAELHPLAGQLIVPKGLVLVYAPRNGAELDVVFELVHASSRFASGCS